MGFAQYLFFDLFLGFIQVEPDDVAAVRHERGDVAVAEVKYSLNDFLLGFINSAGLRSFCDQCFDLFLRNSILL